VREGEEMRTKFATYVRIEYFFRKWCYVRDILKVREGMCRYVRGIGGSEVCAGM